jgi:phospholipid/cholesterol/gamma-HCH transport system substrate-binding protein
MKSSHQIELTAGLFLLLAFAALIFLAVHATDRGVTSGQTYSVTARFTDVGGLEERAKVSMGGVTIGSVRSIELDPQTLEAKVTMEISSPAIPLPAF